MSKKVRLTSSEISDLWAGYMNDSIAIVMLTYFLSHVENKKIKKVLQNSLDLSQHHLDMTTKFFEEDQFPIPQGFSVEKDLDLNAPRLFTDTYILQFVNQLGKLGTLGYSIGVSLSMRPDIFDYYRRCMDESMEIIKRTNEILLEEGLGMRSPYIPSPDKVEFVQKKNFFAGWFGDKRALSFPEVSNLFFNIQRNSLGVTTLIGFSQVAKDKQIKEFFLEGKDIANKHIKVFTDIMKENDLPSPASWDSEVTTSTVSPFSDKLMMFQITTLIALGIGFYGTSMSVSPRHDLALTYARLMAEIGKYSETGANLMIERGWLEQPPLAPNRKH